jgi:two-component system CheB/CheR fusion protein
VKDPPFARIDLVSCRNSLIYIQPNLQKKALTTFHYALKDKGFLVLGRSETTGQAPDLYSIFDKNNKIYTRKSVKGKFFPIVEPTLRTLPARAELANEITNDDFGKNADEVLLSGYVPPSVIVNTVMEIVQFRGSTGIWLEPSSGKPTLNVLKMARDGLAFELRNTLHKVKKSKQTVIKEDIPFQFMGMDKLVSIEVVPLLNTYESHFLILFKDKSQLHDYSNARSNGKTQLSSHISNHAKEKVRIEQIRKELAQAREDMRSITEEQEAANEELQSANEELLSGSEELQSLNEELETSKEEIQTSNEELIIVNQELYDRNEQLNLSRLYSESIVTTIREPLIILDNNMEVRSANKAFYNKFETTPEATERKLFFEIGNKCWNIPALRKMLQKILPDKTNIVDFEFTQNVPALGERIMVINASPIIRDNSEEQSILIAIEDVTQKRRIDKELHLFAEELEKQVAQRTSELKEINIDLQHSNKNLEQFAHIASHDLQEPLRKITVFSSLLTDKYKKDLPEPAKELVSKISAASRRMSNLIQEVLNFSKVLHANAAFEKTDLNAVLTRVIDDFELLVAEKNAVIHRTVLPVIEAIPLQMNQLFYNLISNSMKFARKETAPVITITTKMLTSKAIKKFSTLNQKLSYCQISFKDNGIGFDQQNADKIFLIFQRLHAIGHFAGTGIGLALCKSVVINHHGEIHAISSKNKGAVFQVILPISQ